MSIESCSIKYLDKAYIGVSVRLTNGANVVQFDNKPMSGVEIKAYSHQGFRLNHKNLPKPLWLDFGQLPLKELTIVNGIIQDEITFVENIIRHQTVFIKTDTEAYKNAKAEFKLDKNLVLLPPTKLKPGQTVISAQCKDSIELIFIGNFYQTVIKSSYPEKDNGYNYYYSKQYDYSASPTWKLDDNKPIIERRAYFLRKDTVNHDRLLCKKIIDLVQKRFYPVNVKRNWGYDQKIRDERFNFIKDWHEKNKIDYVYEIVTYPITNKYVRQLMPIGESKKHRNINKNLDLINSYENVGYYSNPEFADDLNFLSGNRYNYYYSGGGLSTRNFLSTNKKTILDETEEFIEWFYNKE